jgi:hypothetical protein
MIALRLSHADRADATVKIAISPVKNAFLREEKRESSSGSEKIRTQLTFSEHPRTSFFGRFQPRREEHQHPKQDHAAGQPLVFQHHLTAQPDS